MEVCLDRRLLALGAMISIGSGAPASGEAQHPLYLETCDALSDFTAHPSARWAGEKAATGDMLDLGVQAMQLGDAPAFAVPGEGEIPVFVREWFSAVSTADLSHHMRIFWNDTRLGGVLDAQESLWRKEVRELERSLCGADVEAFQLEFFGLFPYRAKVVPLANMPWWSWNGFGGANSRECFAACLPAGLAQGDVDRMILVQHEFSHPVVDAIQRLHPEVAAQCAFIEEKHAPAGGFASAYDSQEFRWVETLIRASSVFYLEERGLPAAAAQFAESQVQAGVRAVVPFVSALRPWWTRRKRGQAPGLRDSIAGMPGWLTEATGHI